MIYFGVIYELKRVVGVADAGDGAEGGEGRPIGDEKGRDTAGGGGASEAPQPPPRGPHKLEY